MTAKYSRTVIPLCIIMLWVVTAGAALTSLPESSHYSGTSYYAYNLGSGNVQTGRVEFAVYDTTANPDEFGGYTAPGTGRFIYAYQIFNSSSNDYGLTNTSVPYFVIKSIGANAIASTDDIGTIDDGSSGVNATSYNFNVDKTSAVFEFADGILAAGENSWFLIIRSDQDWMVGTYSLENPQDNELPVPEGTTGDDTGNDDNNSVPEPTALLVMALGTVTLVRRKRN